MDSGEHPNVESVEPGNGSKSTPSYGQIEYWEQRYQKLNSDDNNHSEEKPSNEADDSPAPFHVWYFSFDELKPLLMPLIIGDNKILQEYLDQDHDADESQEKDSTNSDDPCAKSGQNQNDKKTIGAMGKEGAGDGGDDYEEEGEETVIEDEENCDDNEWEEVSDKDDDDEAKDDEADEPRCALEIDGPISVLEIGCGDVPLGLGLGDEMRKLEESTGEKLSSIVEKIVCTDYSPSVINVLKRLDRNKRKLSSGPDDEAGQVIHTTSADAKNNDSRIDSSSQQGKAGGAIPIEFVVADARKLLYPDGSFHLVLEKGTMDALLSDPEDGKSNCLQLVAECARVLATGGCFVLVSHINAQTLTGQKHFEDAIVPSLRNGGGEASWAVEIHGSDVQVEDDGDGSPPSPGPAVYLIFKNKKKGGDSDPPIIPLKFFSY